MSHAVEMGVHNENVLWLPDLLTGMPVLLEVNNKSQSYIPVFVETWRGVKETEGWTLDVPAGLFEEPKEVRLGL